MFLSEESHTIKFMWECVLLAEFFCFTKLFRCQWLEEDTLRLNDLDIEKGMFVRWVRVHVVISGGRGRGMLCFFPESVSYFCLCCFRPGLWCCAFCQLFSWGTWWQVISRSLQQSSLSTTVHYFEAVIFSFWRYLRARPCRSSLIVVGCSSNPNNHAKPS